jgi:hypothetical protein
VKSLKPGDVQTVTVTDYATGEVTSTFEHVVPDWAAFEAEEAVSADQARERLQAYLRGGGKVGALTLKDEGDRPIHGPMVVWAEGAVPRWLQAMRGDAVAETDDEFQARVRNDPGPQGDCEKCGVWIQMHLSEQQAEGVFAFGWRTLKYARTVAKVCGVKVERV